MKYQEIEGNLITLAKEGAFDVIAHGCNCFCRMKRGIAPQMAAAFRCGPDDGLFHLERPDQVGNIHKLGQIEYKPINTGPAKTVTIVNAYTQYQWGTELKPFDYEAFTLCMRKMNHEFKGKHVGLPQIGSHLAGGDWNLIKSIIQKELKDCQVTIVIFKP